MGQLTKSKLEIDVDKARKILHYTVKTTVDFTSDERDAMAKGDKFSVRAILFTHDKIKVPGWIPKFYIPDEKIFPETNTPVESIDVVFEDDIGRSALNEDLIGKDEAYAQITLSNSKGRVLDTAKTNIVKKKF